MALILCPECKDSISDLALACPHCGRPIEVSPPDEDTPYAVVLLDGGPLRDETVVCLSRIDSLSRDEAWTAIRSAPVVLRQDLGRHEANEYAAALGRYCGVKVVPAAEAGSIEDALLAQGTLFPPPSHHAPKPPLTFQEVVFASFWGCLFCTFVCFLLALIF